VLDSPEISDADTTPDSALRKLEDSIRNFDRIPYTERGSALASLGIVEHPVPMLSAGQCF